MTSLSSSKTEFTCFYYCVFGVGDFTGLFRGRVLTIFLWAFSNLLLIVISINIVLAHVISFPTNLVSLNSESVCKSCGCFGKGCSGTTLTRADVIFYYCSRAVLPLLLSGSTAPKSGTKKLHPQQPLLRTPKLTQFLQTDSEFDETKFVGKLATRVNKILIDI